MLHTARSVLSVLALAAILCFPLLTTASAMANAAAPSLPLPGELDPTFGSGGSIVIDFGTGDNGAGGLQPLSGGGFRFFSWDAYDPTRLMQFHRDGSLDTTFNNSGMLLIPTDVRMFTWLSDERLIQAGPDGRLTLRTPTGAVDPDFGGGSSVETPFPPSSAAAQKDGSIVIMGRNDHTTSFDLLLAHYSKTGAPDLLFGTGGVVTLNFNSPPMGSGTLLIQPDGKIIVACVIIDAEYYEFTALVRLNSDGSLDTGFGSGGTLTLSSYGMLKLQNSGKLLFKSRPSWDQPDFLARYNLDGSPDTSFGAGGRVTNLYIEDFEVLPDDRIMVQTGDTTPEIPNCSLVRYTSDGAPDETYGPGGIRPAAMCGPDFALLTGGEIVEAQDFINEADGFDTSVTLLHPDGTWNSEFNPRLYRSMGPAVLQPDGKIVTGAVVWWARLNRLLSDGSPDLGFGAGGSVDVPLGALEDIALQDDGKIVLAGSKTSGNYIDVSLARVNADGSLDTTFGPNGTVITNVQLHDRAHAVLVQPDGKIIAAGETDTGNFDWDFLLFRYLPNGSPDTSFGGGVGVKTDFGSGEAVHALALQPDGKIIAAGIINASFGVARYHPDGSLDTTFGSGGKVITATGVNGCACAVAVQPDGKIIAGGYADAPASFSLVRYLPDGSLDASFGAGGIVATDFGQDRARDMVLRPDGKIILAGGDNGLAVALYNPDGSLDTGFSGDGKAHTFGSGKGYGVLLQPDGRIIAGGDDGSGMVRFAAEPVVQFSQEAYTISESAGSATITAHLLTASGQTVTVQYTTADGSAAAGADYTLTTGTLTFAPGDTSATFSVPILDDASDEPAETILLTLAAPHNAQAGAPMQAALTITDDDEPRPVYLPLVLH